MMKFNMLVVSGLLVASATATAEIELIEETFTAQQEVGVIELEATQADVAITGEDAARTDAADESAMGLNGVSTFDLVL